MTDQVKNNALCECTARCSLCGDVEFQPGVDRSVSAHYGPIQRQEVPIWRGFQAMVFWRHNKAKHAGAATLKMMRYSILPDGTMADGTLLSSNRPTKASQEETDRFRATLARRT